MPAFNDNTGRRWPVVVNVNTIKRVRELVDVDLLAAFDGQLMQSLSADPVLLVNTLYAACKPQAESSGVSELDFGEVLVGDAIVEAANALVEAILDFFPSGRREVLRRLWETTRATSQEGEKLAKEKLSGPMVNQAIQAAVDQASREVDRKLAELCDSFTSRPESAESTPGR